jgi:hypothetical protein
MEKGAMGKVEGVYKPEDQANNNKWSRRKPLRDHFNEKQQGLVSLPTDSFRVSISQ